MARATCINLVPIAQGSSRPHHWMLLTALPAPFPATAPAQQHPSQRHGPKILHSATSALGCHIWQQAKEIAQN